MSKADDEDITAKFNYLMSEKNNPFINLLLKQIGWDNWPQIYAEYKKI
jgi:hypothetical protein